MKVFSNRGNDHVNGTHDVVLVKFSPRTTVVVTVMPLLSCIENEKNNK